MHTDPTPMWDVLLAAVRKGLFQDLEAFGYRRQLGFRSSLSVVPTELAAPHEKALLDLALLILCWEERVAGGEEWDYDALQRLAEEMESQAEGSRVSRPQLSAAMRQVAEAAWTVL